MESYVIPNNLVVSMSDICSSTNTRVQQCLALARVSPVKPGASNCISPYDAGAFNFGRCLQTGTYCKIESGLREEELCEISQGNFYNYVSTTCIVKNISVYIPMVVCLSSQLPGGNNDENSDTNPNPKNNTSNNTPSDFCLSGQVLCSRDQVCNGTQGDKFPEGFCCTGTCASK